MSNRRRLGGVLAAVALCLPEAAATQPLPPSARLIVTIPVAPTAVTMNGRTWLVFELHVANQSAAPITLRDVMFTDMARTTVARFGGDALVRRLGPPAGAGGTDVAAGATRVVYVDIARPEGMATPWSIDYDVLATTATVQMGAVGSVAVNSKPPAPLGPPLAGGPWAAVHHPDWERGHRRVFYTVDGVTRLPGRFTIDFVRLDDAGRTTRGDRDLVASALGYGAPVLAVADATVAATRNDMSEPERVSARMKHPQQDAAGNFVSLDLGEGRFAVYEHPKPGSVRVAPGQRVRRGDVIAQLGFTGDSTGPHLHLHVGDAAAPLAAEGLPFVFEQFEVLGRYPDIAAMGTARWTPDGAGTRRGERPAPNVVIDFRPDRR